MTTVLNDSGQVVNLSWCIVSEHWSEALHGAGGGWAQADLVDPLAVESGVPDIIVSVSIPPDSLLTVDETQLNGAAIVADIATAGMQESP